MPARSRRPAGSGPGQTPAVVGGGAPRPPSALIGRNALLDALADRVQQPGVRLLTLTGPAGVGKTRLALALAERLTGAYRDGVWFVDLTVARHAADVLPSIARVLAVRANPRRSPPVALQAHLRDRQLLLVLDNFEHVLAARTQIADLLAGCPGLTLLVTSRAALGLRWEHQAPVPPLAVSPESSVQSPVSGSVSSDSGLWTLDSVRLFVQRARAVQPEFELTDANAAAVTAICRAVGGLPLAIELAAARVRVLPPRMMVEWLAQPFDLLAGGAADLPERHRSARDAIAWSYDLLGPAEQTLLRALSVFVGGATLEAIAAVALDPRGEPHVGASVLLDQLALLIDHSLLTQEPQEDGRPRYLLPLLVREYAAEQARAAGERFRLQRAHACHYLALAQEAAWGLEGPAQARWLRRLDLDHENLRTAIRWAVDEGEPSIGLQLLSAARHFLWLHGDLGEARRWLDGLLARPGAAPEPVRARALLTAGQFAFYQGDFARAAEQLEDAARTAAGVADHQTRILAHLVLCRVALAQGDAETARLWIEEGHALARATGDATLLCESLNYLGLVLDQDPDVARSYFEHNLSFFSRHGDEWGTGPALRGLGLIAWTQGNLALAGRLLADGVSLYRQKGSRHGLSVLLHDLGQVLLTRGDTTGAAGAFGESMTTARRLGNPALCALALAGLACVAVSGGRTRRAVRWFGASAEARDRYGAALEEVGRATYREFVGRTRRALGESEFLTLWTEGRSLPLERAADEALAEACPAPEQAAAAVLDAGRRYGLTRRELEVVALLGQGRSNREIGAALVITEGTANLHVRHILAKLGVASRAQAAVWAVQQGLIASAAAVVESRAGLAAVRRAT